MNNNLIVLIALHSDKFPSLGESHGVCAISGYIKSRFPKVQVKIFDLQIHARNYIMQYIISHRPFIVGLSVKLYTFNQVDYFYQQISLIPILERPIIVLGNAVPTFNGEYILREKYNDVIIGFGEGEYTFRDLILYNQGKIELKDVCNIMYLHRGTIKKNINKYVLPYDIVLPDRTNTKKFYLGGNEVYIEGSRGCAYSACTICACKDFLGSRKKINRWRSRPLRLIVDDFVDLQSRGVMEVTFADEDFIGEGIEGNKRIISLCKLLIQNQNTVRFRMNACVKSFFSKYDSEEVQRLKEEMVSLLKKAGLSKVFLGLESTVDSQLKRYRKGFDLDEFYSALTLLKKYKIDCEYGIILCDPLMSYDELKESVRSLNRLKFVDNIATLFKELRVQIKHDYVEMIKKYEIENDRSILGNFDFNQQSYKIIEYADTKVNKFVLAMRRYCDDIYKFYYALRIHTRYEELYDEEKNCFSLISDLRQNEYNLMIDIIDILENENENSRLNIRVCKACNMSKQLVKEFVENVKMSTCLENVLNEAKNYLKNG